MVRMASNKQIYNTEMGSNECLRQEAYRLYPGKTAAGRDRALARRS